MRIHSRLHRPFLVLRECVRRHCYDGNIRKGFIRQVTDPAGGFITMIVRKEIDLNQPLAPAQTEMLNKLASRPITPDEDCPELTMEQLAQFRRISAANREERCKQTVTLRLSPQAIRRAKSLGKGYTSVLSRILESALENPDIVRHHL